MCPDQKDFQPSWETAGRPLGDLKCKSFEESVNEITCYCKQDNCNAGNEKPTKSQPIVENTTKPEDNGSDGDNGSDDASSIQLGMGLVMAMMLVNGI